LTLVRPPPPQASAADSDARAHTARLELRLEELSSALRRAEDASTAAGASARRGVRDMLQELIERVAQQLEGLKAGSEADVAAVRAEQAAQQQQAAEAVRRAAAASAEAEALRGRVAALADAVASRDAFSARTDKQLVRVRCRSLAASCIPHRRNVTLTSSLLLCVPPRPPAVKPPNSVSCAPPTRRCLRAWTSCPAPTAR
jgi:hypothetical protein